MYKMKINKERSKHRKGERKYGEIYNSNRY